jgi:beta-xylosidase
MLAVLAGPLVSIAQEARNPVIHADVPDPAVVRKGTRYYMASTTMHMSPGLPIMASDDLVNWTLVSYAYNVLAEDDALRLQHGENAYGRGSWAPSLRFHDGWFYASTFSSTTGRTHVYRTRDVERGDWEAFDFAPALHDHSLYFEDDRVFMVYGAGEIHLVELEPDFSGLRTGGLNTIIIPDASAVAGDDIMLAAEGSQLQKIDGRYYLLNITWPRGGMRTVIVHRADSLTGPWEGRVALQDKGVAQGSLIDTPDGDWYAVLFQDRGAVGRVPWLVPVQWTDGWPVFGTNGEAPVVLDVPADGNGIEGIVASDDFSRAPGDPPLPLAWQWNHNPRNELWSVEARPGWLRLTTGDSVGNFEAARNTLTQRTFGPRSAVRTIIDMTNMRDGDFAGLGLLQRDYGLLGVQIDGEDRSLQMVAAADGVQRVVASVPLQQPVVHLRVDCDFADLQDRAVFRYSLDGSNWRIIGEPLAMKYTLPQHFMGYRFSLFNYATRNPGGFADFDTFQVSDGLD